MKHPRCCYPVLVMNGESVWNNGAVRGRRVETSLSENHNVTVLNVPLKHHPTPEPIQLVVK